MHEYSDEITYETDKFHIGIMRKTGVFELAVYADESFSVISLPRMKKHPEYIDFSIYVIDQIIQSVDKPKSLSYYKDDYKLKRY